jgi:hypothetical protein
MTPPPQEASDEAPEEEMPGQITDTVEAYNRLDWLTRVSLLIAVCWLGWVYRERLGRLIPGGNGKKKKG